MQYAQVLINSKTDELEKYFTYKIPPQLLAYIKVGSVVKIPFGPYKKIGVVAQISRKVDNKIKNKLKDISSLEYKTNVLSQLDLQIAKMISRYYLVNLGQVVFFMIPKLSKRIISKNIDVIDNKTNPQIKIINSLKKYSIYDDKENRVKKYIKLVKKAFAKHKSAIILFSDLQANEYFIKEFKKIFNKDLVVFRPNDTTTQIGSNWVQINSQNNVLIIGTRNTIFFTPKNTALIIIDEPQNYGFKEEQIIHHNVSKVAEFYAKSLNANLILGSNYHSIENIIDKQSGQIVSRNNFVKSKKITILDNSQSKNNFVTYSVKKLIENYIAHKKTLLVLSNQKGASSGMICKNCGEILRCPRCEKILYKKNKNSQEVICPVCNYMIEISQKCPGCGEKSVVDFGLAIDKIKDILSNEYSQRHLKVMTHDDGLKIEKNKYIYIATNYATMWKNLKFDGVVVIDWENWLSLRNGYNYFQKMVSNFYDLCEISKNAIYLQTTDPENEDLKNLVGFRFDQIIDKDLKLRQKYHYPPYYQIIKIYHHDLVKTKSVKILEKVRSNIKKLLKNIDISEIINEGKVRDKYHCSLVVRIPRHQTYQIKKFLYTNYKRLGLPHCLIDVNPININ